MPEIDGLALAFGCDVWAGHDILANPLNSVGFLACFGALVSYLYSAPPYKLKAEGWRGSFALGASYRPASSYRIQMRKKDHHSSSLVETTT